MEHGLGRRKEFDAKSKRFPIRQLLDTGKAFRSYTWRVAVWLDQQRTPECVGYSWAHELAARPVVRPATVDIAHRIYRGAQDNDQWPGNDYEGSSVLGGAKFVQELGYMDEYRWAFSLDDLIRTVGHHGPAVLGTEWDESMFDPDKDGFLVPNGNVAGGHAWLVYSVNVPGRFFRMWQSWGRGWGDNGTAKVSFDAMGQLLDRDGEACIPVRRR
jgi:hypothetical protein